MKIDYKREWKHLYEPPAGRIVQVDVPEMQFLMADGEGDPNGSPAYAAAVEALFAVSYAAKFAVKKGPSAVDYAVMPLEGLWWADDMSRFSSLDRAGWKWTVMILQPPLVTPELLERAIAEVARKKGAAAVAGLRCERLAEGLSAQTLHIGPFSEEGPTILRLHDFIAAERRTPAGRHHEIYLSDIRKTDPAKWKTVLRQPMR